MYCMLLTSICLPTLFVTTNSQAACFFISIKISNKHLGNGISLNEDTVLGEPVYFIYSPLTLIRDVVSFIVILPFFRLTLGSVKCIFRPNYDFGCSVFTFYTVCYVVGMSAVSTLMFADEYTVNPNFG